ncbi:hypothetical protein PybrP1_002851 [[Pythium] brassicae (nom. inval.)]|nr:hypothetical protein PybrP1_002851 [[Pythium] brassicae (nom. inval.)]
MLCFPRSLFLRALCAVYLAAFVSVRSQIRGLYGDDGLEPVSAFLARLSSHNPEIHSASSALAKFVAYPTLVWLHEPLRWSPSFAMEVICLAGATLAALGVCNARWRTALPLALAWLCYLSTVQCGQTFMRFQWDAFLLEVGFLAIWIAPWWRQQQREDEREHADGLMFETPAAGAWNLRFLFFKFMFMSGSVKIQSRCPTWLRLTALEFHYATQPLPLPLAWHAHSLPPLVNRVAVAATLLIEGPWTFFILAPHLMLRRFAAATQVLLQIGILFTGNYNFFNLLTVVMALGLLDLDSGTADKPRSKGNRRAALAWITKADSRWQRFQNSSRAAVLMWVATALYCLYTAKATFAAWIARVLPASVVFAACVAVFASLWQMLRAAAVLFEPDRRGVSALGNRSTKLVYLLVCTVANAWVFSSSVLTLSILDPPFQNSLPPFVSAAYQAAEGYWVTKIVLEGTADEGRTWREYHFKHKPGDQLLDGVGDVKELLDTRRDPFPDTPPQAIRALLYYYDFTRASRPWSRGSLNPAFVMGNAAVDALDKGNDALQQEHPHWWSRVFARDEMCAMLQTLVRSEHSPLGLAAVVLMAKNIMDVDTRKCHTCGNTGHLRRDCPEAPAQAEGAFAGNANTCFGCGKTGHLKRDCPTGGRACHNCGNVGHIRRDCPEDVQPPKCHNCGNTGHLRRDCPDDARESRKCHSCGNSGHLRRDCPEDNGPSADKCYQCGESGHWARNCTGVKA